MSEFTQPNMQCAHSLLLYHIISGMNPFYCVFTKEHKNMNLLIKLPFRIKKTNGNERIYSLYFKVIFKLVK